MTEDKRITLCADDFGYSPGICEGMLKLAQSKRLSAVSCMVNATAFPTYAKELSALASQVQIGLHFNLTEGFFLSQPKRSSFSLHELLVKTHLRLVSSSLIEAEFNAQLDCFVQLIGRMPDFIDGHQHVHQLPGIRAVLLHVYEQRLKEHGTFIRSTWPAITLPSYQWKARVLALSGGKALHHALVKRAIAHNDFFTGVYDFSPRTDYRELFRQWLHLAPNNTLIMCHPGEGVSDSDPIAATRLLEMAYFLSADFLDDCVSYRVRLS